MSYRSRINSRSFHAAILWAKDTPGSIIRRMRAGRPYAVLSKAEDIGIDRHSFSTFTSICALWPPYVSRILKAFEFIDDRNCNPSTFNNARSIISFASFFEPNGMNI